ncbi:MAG: site-specific integrase [Coprobacillaceae bacterium]
MAYKKNDKGLYDVDVSYTKLNGKYGRKRKNNITTLKEAKLIEAEFIAVYRNGEVRDVKLKAAIDQFIDYKRVRVKETHIIKTLTLMNLVKDLWNFNIESIKPQHITKLQSDLKSKHLSVTYINECVNRLYSVFEFSRTFNNTSNNPCEKVERLKRTTPKEPITFWTLEEFTQFDNAIKKLCDDAKNYDEHFSHFEYRVFFNFLYCIGTRCGETQALNWNDLDLDNNHTVRIDKTLTFRTSKGLYNITTPKTLASNRTVTIPLKLIEMLSQLKEYKIEHGRFSEKHFVFGYPDTPFHNSTLTRRKNMYCELAGVKQIKIHDFRHSHASLLINNDVNILVICSRLGHADVKMTLNTYSHMFKSTEDEALHFLNNL